MTGHPLAHKAHDITEATALTAESPSRWASVFAHIYCDLLSDADQARREQESSLLGLDLFRIERLAALGGEPDDECLAETIRVLGSRNPSQIDAEVWFARTKAMLGLDRDDLTEVAR